MGHAALKFLRDAVTQSPALRSREAVDTTHEQVDAVFLKPYKGNLARKKLPKLGEARGVLKTDVPVQVHKVIRASQDWQEIVVDSAGSRTVDGLKI